MRDMMKAMDKKFKTSTHASAKKGTPPWIWRPGLRVRAIQKYKKVEEEGLQFNKEDMIVLTGQFLVGDRGLEWLVGYLESDPKREIGYFPLPYVEATPTWRTDPTAAVFHTAHQNECNVESVQPGNQGNHSFSFNFPAFPYPGEGDHRRQRALQRAAAKAHRGWRPEPHA